MPTCRSLPTSYNTVMYWSCNGVCGHANTLCTSMMQARRERSPALTTIKARVREAQVGLVGVAA
eukprot:3805112-Rhodomonas_salina.1